VDGTRAIKGEKLDGPEPSITRRGRELDNPLRIRALLEAPARGRDHLEAQLRRGIDDDGLLAKLHRSPSLLGITGTAAEAP
jgi:hypothetical protein